MNAETGKMDLNSAQSKLLQVTNDDMKESCKQYLAHPSMDNGQQVLTDLKRMEHLVHKHLGLQGDTEPSWPMPGWLLKTSPP